MGRWPKGQLAKELWLDNLFGQLGKMAERILTLETHVGTVNDGVMTGSTLDSLDDVLTSGKISGDWLRYTGSLWMNATTTQMLTDLKTVDGPGSGLNADLLDGSHLADIQAEIDADVASHTANENAHHNKLHSIISATDHSVTGSAWDVVGLSATDTLGILGSSAAPGASEKLLKTTAAGLLTLANLDIAAAGVLDFLNVGTIQTTAGDLTINPAADLVLAGANTELAPSGNVIVNPTGTYILPNTTYWGNIGKFDQKFLTLHVAEIMAQTLVAVDVMATIGGRIIVAPTTTLTRDITAGATTVYLKHNSLASGDRVILEAHNQVEFMAITSSATLQAEGDYSYTVTRNLDGSGANSWYAGDAVVNTGTTGSGFIDLYSMSQVNPATEKIGPTIVGNIRRSATYNDWQPHFALGYLDNLYGFTGIAAAIGAADKAHVLIDDSDGIRLYSATSTLSGQWKLDGTILIGSNVAAAATTALAIFGTAQTYNSESVGQHDMIIGDNTASKANIFWDKSAGILYFRGGTTPQAYIDTDGAITAGGGKTILDANGIGITTGTAFGEEAAISFFDAVPTRFSNLFAYTAGSTKMAVWDIESLAATKAHMQIKANSPSGQWSRIDLQALTNGAGATIQLDTLISTRVEIEPELIVKGSPGDLTVYGNFISYKSSTEHVGYIYKPLTTRLSGGSGWTAASKSAADNNLYNVNTVWGVPTAAKAVVFFIAQSSSTQGAYLNCGSSSTETNAQVMTQVSSTAVAQNAVVSVNASGEVYFGFSATMTVWVYVCGYFI